MGAPPSLPPPSGILRLLVVFHESEALGAGRSVVQAVGALEGYGWTTSGWFPGEGPLLDVARRRLATRLVRSKPIRYSVRGWREDPGVVARMRATPSYLRSFRRALLGIRPHVVHANTLRTLPEARVARSLGLPVVVHVHELPDPGLKSELTIRSAARSADVLVAVSDAVAARVRGSAGRTPVLVAHNGIEPSRVRVAAEGGGIVGTVGTVCRTKGTDVFLEAASLALARCPELRFEHIGQSGLDGDIAFRRRVDGLAGGLGESLEMLGGRPAVNEIVRWESFVSASRQDAFPLATLEAMSAGVPVVATDVGGVSEQIDHLETGVLVPPDRPEALAEWIVRLHRDPELRRRLGSAAAAHVAQRFTIAGQAAVLHAAYLAALNLRHGPPLVRRRTLEAA